MNKVVDENFTVFTSAEDVIRFNAMSDLLQKNDNALDRRANVITINFHAKEIHSVATESVAAPASV